MIATLSGRLRRRLEDRIILEVSGIGYEVFLPPIALRALEGAHAERSDKATELALVIYYHATRDQPRPAGRPTPPRRSSAPSGIPSVTAPFTASPQPKAITPWPTTVPGRA